MGGFAKPASGQTRKPSQPNRDKFIFVADHVSNSVAIQMLEKGLYCIRKNMPKATDRAYDAAVPGGVEAFNKTAHIFQYANNMTNVDFIRRLAEEQAAVAASNAFHKTFGHKPLRNLHHMIF